jgi:amino acid transporter
MTNEKRKKIGVWCLVIATFLNPFGFTELFAMVMKLSGDYWVTTYIFYTLAFLFFLLSFYFLRINPIKRGKEKVKEKMDKIKNKNASK